MHLPASIASQQLLGNHRRQHITTSMASPFMQRVSGLTATYCTPVTTAKLNASPRAIILHVPLNSLGMDRRRLMQRSRCHRFAICNLGLLLCALGVGLLGGLLILFLGSLGAPTWHLVKGDDFLLNLGTFGFWFSLRNGKLASAPTNVWSVACTRAAWTWHLETTRVQI